MKRPTPVGTTRRGCCSEQWPQFSALSSRQRADISLRVTDDGTPGLSATQSVWVAVNRPVLPKFRSLAVGGDTFHLDAFGDAGPDYHILGSTNLLDWALL